MIPLFETQVDQLFAIFYFKVEKENQTKEAFHTGNKRKYLNEPELMSVVCLLACSIIPDAKGNEKS